MEVLGTVVEIFGSSMILVEAERTLTIDEVLHVFAEVENPELTAKYGLICLQIPKGEIRIVANQKDRLYLAETFRTQVSGGRVVERPPSLLSGILGSEIIRETVQGPLSASLGNPTVPVAVTRRVEVGDRVGRS